jgi:hypothetical protein
MHINSKTSTLKPKSLVLEDGTFKTKLQNKHIHNVPFSLLTHTPNFTKTRNINVVDNK